MKKDYIIGAAIAIGSFAWVFLAAIIYSFAEKLL